MIGMEDRINVLGIDMDSLSAKENMRCAMKFMESDSVDTIEIMTMDVLMKEQENTEWKSWTGEMKLFVPGESEILEAAGIHDRRTLKETDGRVFLKMFLKYLDKNRKKVYLLAEKQEQIQRVENAIHRYNSGIRLTGHSLLSQDDNREEEVVNDINGTETDCIISVLQAPYQEEFICRNKTLLNVKVWFGCGPMLEKSYERRKLFYNVRHFFRKTMFHHQVEKQQKQE